MARPQKDGLDYFPLDVDIDQDDKVQLIEAEFGITGFGIIIKLFMKIYKEGYFYQWTEKERLLFSSKVNVDINQVNDIINSCIKWGLFNKEIYEKHHILTSAGIQRRYLEAVSRRKQVTIVQEFCLIDVSCYKNVVVVDINGVIVDINPSLDSKNDNKNPQSKVKKSKVKKSTFAEFVTMTENEYNNLVEKYGESNVKQMIETLDNYKGSTGKKYKSDYRAILNWVANKVLKETANNQTNPFREKAYQSLMEAF